MLDYRTILAAVAAVLLLGWLAKRETAAAAQAVNPLNNNNVFAQAADGVVESLTDGQTKTTGGLWFKHCKARNFEPWYCPNV